MIMRFGSLIVEPEHDKIFNKTFVTRKDSDQPLHPSSKTRILVYPCLDIPEAVGGHVTIEDSDQPARMRRVI